MSVRVVCVVLFVCQLAWLGDSTSPYGSNGPLNGHDVGKKGPENRYQDHDKSRTSGTHTCSDDFVFRSNYIIRTSESLENSAVFIDSIKVGSSDSCIENCCDANDVIDEDGKSVTCDLAVFVDVDENKGKKLESNCFLFQCRFDTGERNRCLFAEHDGYVSNMIGGFGEEAVFPEREEEEVEEEVPQTKRPAPATTKGREENKETEDTDDEGTDENACNEYQYTCNNGECIRLSLLCDEYKDCEDESDEKEETCAELNGEVEPSRNGNESEPAKEPPTNPPKPHTTNTNNQRQRPALTTTTPDSKEDDTIFSELAQQLHKEGAKQKMRDKSEEDDEQQSDWNTSNESDKDGRENGHPDDESRDRQNNDKDDEDYQWRPKHRGRPYYNRRPDRPRPDDRYNDNDRTSNGDYRDYPNRQDDDQDDHAEEDNRKDDGGGDHRDKADDKYQDSKDRHRPDENDKDHQNDKSDTARKNNDEKVEESSSGGGSQQDKDKWQNKNDKDDRNGSGQKESPRPKPKGGETTMEDWYGKHQPDKEEPGGGGHDYDSHRNDYHDYLGGKYYDRNRYRGYPNQNRYPYGPGDYQDYQDYNRQGNDRLSPGRGGADGRGRGNNKHNWNQSENQDGDSQEELDDKLQGDDHTKTNTADVPHSRRLRPGLWKIWRYMYGSSAADYVTEYPPAAPGQDKGPEDHVVEDEDKDEQETTGDEDKEQIVKVPTTNGILNTKQDNEDPADQVMETQQSGLPSENPKSNQSISNSKTSEVKALSGSKTGTKTAESVGAHSDVRVEDINNQGGVTATAVLPLTIGLFLTMFLLLMMSCRLRYMNRRLRYGRLKTNNAHDADYLINGMYL